MKKKHLIPKILITAILAMLMLFGGTLSTFAAAIQEPSISPLWENIYIMRADISFSESDGNATGSTRKQSTADSIEGTLTVYKWENNDWVYIDSAYGSKTIGTLAVSIDFTCVSGVEYKAVWVVTAYSDGVAETDTYECTKVC